MEAAPAPFPPMARFIRCPSPVMTTRQFTTGTWITATSISGRWLKTSPGAAWTQGMDFAWTPMSGGPRCPAGCHPAAQGMAGHIRTDRRSGGAFGEAGRGDRGCVPAHRLPGRRRRSGSRGRSGGAVPGLAPGPLGNGLRRDTLPGRHQGVLDAAPESRRGVSRKDAGLAWPRARRSWDRLASSPGFHRFTDHVHRAEGWHPGPGFRIDVVAPDRGRSPGFMPGRPPRAVCRQTARLWPFWRKRSWTWGRMTP